MVCGLFLILLNEIKFELKCDREKLFILGMKF